ncbi:sulfite exporter TauE/SafE family protein [Candidatus Deianiraea vastatrix]|uniref:Probable membrane transporter protein n=1 Tax=Candidatus Deianiraea vastatrix TaxID=2163644 RepID=A0A5B8XEW1_9RICK|nr:sulfite exporter TauE/SafE family protein [Candidatus Deianiraea vastatrix]QED23848.1 Putative anion permease [Candidatus Deianiraea vastatrix]
MLDIYLPIAQMSISLMSLVFLGFFSGTLSGIYGIGGGVVAVPMMIFAGIPTNIAIATSLLQIIGASLVNVVRNSNNVKYKIAIKIGIFSIIGSFIGTFISINFNNNQYFYTTVNLMYMILLTVIIITTLSDVAINLFVGGKSTRIVSNDIAVKHHNEDWRMAFRDFENFMEKYGLPKKTDSHYLDLKAKFRNIKDEWKKSLYVGLIIGIFSGIMGIGGGFISVPAIIYIFRQDVKIAATTSSLIALITTLPASILQMNHTSSVEPFIAIISSIFMVFGVRIGNFIATLLPQNVLKFIFGIILCYIAFKFGQKLFTIPHFPYVISCK